MIHVEKDGKKVRIDVLDYEFPNRDDIGGVPSPQQLERMGGKDEDANWLNLQFDCSDSKYAWKVQDPSMSTYDMKDLLDWFVVLSEGNADSMIAPYITFTDATVTIFQQPAGADMRLIRFIFAYDVLPEDEMAHGEYIIDFVLNRGEIAQIATDIAEAMAKFPIR
jgi:hypothetical protein